MKLEKLDLFEFFKDEHGRINGGSGIGASGVITNLQMINVVNIDDFDVIDISWGTGSHYDTYKEMFNLIYDLSNNVEWNNSSLDEKNFIIERLLESVISIRYVNQYERYSDKYIIVKIPTFVSYNQYDYLCKFNEMIEECMCKYRISVKVLLKGNEVFSQKYFDLKVNNIPDVLKYLKVNNRIGDNYNKYFFENEVIVGNDLLKEVKNKR